MRRTAALVLLPLALAGCATGGSPDAASDRSAASRLADARTAAGAMTTFAFRSVTELPGSTALQRTMVDGRAAVPDKVAYTVTVGDRTIDVVRIGTQGFSRTLPGGAWQPEQGAAPAAAPATVLREVLAAADAPVDRGDVEFDGVRARLLEVTLSADEVRASGLLDAKGGGDVQVTLALDEAGRVLRLAVDLPVQAGGTSGSLRQVTTYGSFGAAEPITAPV